MPLHHAWPRLCAKCEHFASELNTGADGLCHFEMTDGVSNDILMENYTINVLNHDINEDFPLAMTLLKAEQSKRNYRRHSENQGTKTTLEQSLSKTPMSTQLMGKLQFLWASTTDSSTSIIPTYITPDHKDHKLYQPDVQLERPWIPSWGTCQVVQQMPMPQNHW